MPPKNTSAKKDTAVKTAASARRSSSRKTRTSAPEAAPSTSTSANTPTTAPSGTPATTTTAPPPPSSTASTTEEFQPSKEQPPLKGRQAKKAKAPSTSTTSESAAAADTPAAPAAKSRKGKAAARGRVPTLPAAILRARGCDLRLRVQAGGPPPSQEVRDDPHLLPWVPHLLDALELPELGMLDPEYQDGRGNHPSATEKKEFVIFFNQVKENPEICSQYPLKDIPGSDSWRRWAYKTWAPKLAAIVRAELVKTGDSWTQRQLKSEKNHAVDMGAASVANERKKEILQALFGDAAFNTDKHATMILGMDLVVKDLVYRVCDQERKRYRTLQPLLESARRTIKQAISTMSDPAELDIAQFKKAVTKANELRSIFAQVSIEPEDDDEQLLDDFMGASMKVIAAKEALLKNSGGTTDRMVWNQAQIMEAQDIYAANFLTSESMIDIVHDEVLTETVLISASTFGHIPHMKPFEAVRDNLPAGGPKSLWDFDALQQWAKEHLPLEEQTTPPKMLHPVPTQRNMLLEEEMERQCPRTHQLLRCHLHQVQGVMAIAEQAFKATEGKVHISTMLADSMGLGKTLTAITYALMVAHWYQIQHSDRGRDMPAHLAQRFWCGLKEIPNAPIIIIVPNNLLTQWVSELRSFVQPALVDVLVFDPRGKGAAEAWWPEQWDKSEIEPHRRIIVTTSNAVKRESDRVLRSTARRRAEHCFPGDRVVPLKDNCVDLFSIKSSVLILDEIHDYRNLNRDAHGVLTISNNAHHTVGLTGTPVYNATADLLPQACVLGIPEFVGENFALKKAEVTKQIPKRRGKATLPEGNDIRAQVIAAQSKLVDDNKLAIEMLKKWLSPYIIRRTMASQDPYGNRILPPIHNTVSKSYVKLSADEEKRTNQMCDVRDTAGGGTSKVFNTQNFYTEYRLCLQYPGHGRNKSENLRIIAQSKSWQKADFDDRSPSKMLRVVDILDYHIPEPLRHPLEPWADVSVADRVRTALKWSFPSGDKVSTPSQAELAQAWGAQQAILTQEPSSSGSQLASPPPDIPIVGGLRRTKVIITLTYTIYLPILVRLLNVRGYAVRTFTGDTPIVDRGKIIEEFNQDDAHHADGDDGYSFILIMSGIGITGLNCTRGAVMIHFDQAWSQQEENQATHRIVRLGQVEHCIIYKILALGTTDIWMNQIASGKELMLDLFSGHDSLALQALKNPALIAVVEDEDDGTAVTDLDKQLDFDPSTVDPLPDDEAPKGDQLDAPSDDDLSPSIPYRDKGKQKEGAPPIPPSAAYAESPSGHLHFGGLLDQLPQPGAGEPMDTSTDDEWIDVVGNEPQEPQEPQEPNPEPQNVGGKRAAASSPDPALQPARKRGAGKLRGTTAKAPITNSSRGRSTRSQVVAPKLTAQPRDDDNESSPSSDSETTITAKTVREMMRSRADRGGQ